MAGLPFSSGDMRADRRVSFAEMLADDGDFAGAAEVMRDTLDEVPDWAAGWFLLGQFLEQAGDVSAAIVAWDRTVALDPADPFGASLKRDLARPNPVAETMPAAFVERLFDQYANRFETSLVEGLSYKGPDLVMSALDAAGFTQAEHALDLGCGTGLMGALLRPRCDRLTGFDISAGMLSEAEAKGLYDTLEKTDIDQRPLEDARYDLIVAADVFVYIGALERVIGWCAAALQPGGRLAFTVERGEDGIVLRESRRFAHSAEYVETLLRDAGMTDIVLKPCVTRQDRGADIPSLCVTAQAAMVRDRDADPDRTETFA